MLVPKGLGATGGHEVLQRSTACRHQLSGCATTKRKRFIFSEGSRGVQVIGTATKLRVKFCDTTELTQQLPSSRSLFFLSQPCHLAPLLSSPDPALQAHCSSSPAEHTFSLLPLGFVPLPAAARLSWRSQKLAHHGSQSLPGWSTPALTSSSKSRELRGRLKHGVLGQCQRNGEPGRGKGANPTPGQHSTGRQGRCWTSHRPGFVLRVSLKRRISLSRNNLLLQTTNNRRLWRRPQAPQDSNALFATSFRSTGRFNATCGAEQRSAVREHKPPLQTAWSSSGGNVRNDGLSVGSRGGSWQQPHRLPPLLRFSEPTLLFQPQVPFPASPGPDPSGPPAILHSQRRRWFCPECHQRG